MTKRLIKIQLRRVATDGNHATHYELVKLTDAVVLRSIVGSFGADHRVGDVLDEKQAQYFVDNPMAYEVTIAKA